jgi:hypothetical protein
MLCQYFLGIFAHEMGFLCLRVSLSPSTSFIT